MFNVETLDSSESTVIIVLGERTVAVTGVGIAPVIPTPYPDRAERLITVADPARARVALLDPGFFSSVGEPPVPCGTFSPSSPIQAQVALSDL